MISNTYFTSLHINNPLFHPKMAESHSAAFEKAIEVTPVDSHTYSAHLDAKWCIGVGMLYTRGPDSYPVHQLTVTFPSPPWRIPRKHPVPHDDDSL